VGQNQINRDLPSDRARIIFRAVVVAALAAAFGQVTLGGVVRVTGSGLGCPDWPLCHGQIIPPFDAATLIEYSHRLSASVLGLLVVANAVVTWLYFKERRELIYASLVAVALVAIAAVLGGVTVLTELEWWVVLFHLGMAEALVACLVFAAIAGWNRNVGTETFHQDIAKGPTSALVSASVAGTFIVILSGSYMVGYGAGPACGTWPLCRGDVIPEGAVFLIHMIHRFVAAAVGLIVLAAAWRVWNRAAGYAAARVAAGSVAAAFLLQIALGAVLIWTGFSANFKAIHLSVATLVWIALVAMAAIVHRPQRTAALAYGQA
jgi:heme A synthase